MFSVTQELNFHVQLILILLLKVLPWLRLLVAGLLQPVRGFRLRPSHLRCVKDQATQRGVSPSNRIVPGNFKTQNGQFSYSALLLCYQKDK
jgi:hypothetical protein